MPPKRHRVFIIHGWGGRPEGDWLPWAKKELENRGYEVVVPSMPDTKHPKITPWLAKLAEVVGTPRPDDIFIGHSVGCQTILRYLEHQQSDIRVDKVILIAPWVALKDLESNEMWKIIDEWLKSPMDFANIRPKAKEYITVYSDNDPWVTYPENKDYLDQHLHPHQSIVKHNHAHFHEEAGYLTLPFFLNMVD